MPDALLGNEVDESRGAGLVWTLVVLGALAVVVSGWLQLDFMNNIGGEVPARWRLFIATVLGALGGPMLIGGLVGLVLLRVRR